MRTLVIGAGAVGGYFGGRLAEAGRDITFLVRPTRKAQLERTGLQIIDKAYGDATLQPKLILAKDLPDQTFDLILVSTKAYSLAAAIEDFAPAVGPETIILPLLNGMAHMDTLDARFGQDRVIGGYVQIIGDMDTEGRILSLGKLHDLNFGERDKSVTPRIQALAALMQGAIIEANLKPDIMAAMWQKWTLLAAMGAITCLLRGSVGAVAAAPGGPETAHAIIAECSAIAAANGYPPDPGFHTIMTQRLTEPGSALTASMYRDLQRGSPVEAGHILGDLLARGRAHNIDAPLTRAAFAQLSIYTASLDN
jgi:2-dehydropantoate 2-reductase